MQTNNAPQETEIQNGASVEMPAYENAERTHERAEAPDDAAHENANPSGTNASDARTAAESSSESQEPQVQTTPAEDWKDRYLRLASEFDNFKKRTVREKEHLIKYGNEHLLRALLPIVDDLIRTLTAAQTSDNLEKIREGVGLVYKNLLTALERQGVVPIKAQGCDFDADFHEAIASIPAGDEMRGKVVEEVEKGYMFHDKVLRYAKVVTGE
ncbi:MAG: nucleotide exchange factor GrpE [Bacteroidia bacterium]|nr:nucleotide exchange factor GrpE [Bacteroidia bacterium]MDW8333420.1 nucleotide exchange factor GrpE [Bacteroidia bacterium]